MAVERCSIESCDEKVFAKAYDSAYCVSHWRKVKKHYKGVGEELYNFCMKCNRIIPKPFKVCRTCKEKNDKNG